VLTTGARTNYNKKHKDCALVVNDGNMSRLSMAYITCCVSGVDFKHKTFSLHGHFFFSFFRVGKNNFKIYLQKFV